MLVTSNFIRPNKWSAPMQLKDFSRANMERCKTAFAPAHGTEALVLCIMEEVGELSASVLGWTGKKKRKAHLTKADTADAIADAVTYLDLLATHLGYDLHDLLRDTFNMVSDRCGSGIKV